MNPERMRAPLLIATGNPHKVDEIRQIVGRERACCSMRQLGVSLPMKETAETFKGNAAAKAMALARWAAQSIDRLPAELQGGCVVLADDSGLEVDALDGAPGVRSARFAAEPADGDGNASDAANNQKLLRLLQGVPAEQRGARFRCVIAAVKIAADGSIAEPVFAEGRCEGRIGFEPHGENGFGYDPLFVPKGFSKTFAQLTEDEKNRISHRAQALHRLRI